MVKETCKRWQRKECSVHTLHPFLAIHLAGMLGASWQRQVSIYTPNKAPLEATFSHYKSPKNHKAGHNACFMTSFIALSCCFHTHRYTVEWAKYSRKRAPSTLTLSWKIPDEPPIWKFAAASHMLCWDLWPLEKRNSIQGQRQGLTTWRFLCSSFAKVS